MQPKLPIECLAHAASVLYLQHYQETGQRLNINAAEASLGQWEDGQYYLRVNFPDGYWWELAFGPEGDAIIAAAAAEQTATRH